MGKDRAGNFHPGKGKPSGVNKEEGLGLHPTDPEKLEQYLDITEKYTLDSDELAPNVPVRHPNRNTSKGEDQYKGKTNQKESDKTVNENFHAEQALTPTEEIPWNLTKDGFRELAAFSGECCITVYITSNRSGVEVNEQKDLVKFKNTLQDVSRQLQQSGKDELAIRNLLQPGYELLRDEKFFRNLTEGIAFFIADNHFKYIRLPYAPVENIYINNSFSVGQLVPLMSNTDYFYLLVISKKQSKLFRADAFGMTHIPIDEIPNGVDDVVRFENKDDEKLFRTGGRGGTGGANFHGIGGGKPDEKTHIGIYLEEVDDTIWKEVLHTENVPLLLAGVEYLIPIYRSVTDYNHLWDDALTGSHEHEDTATLYQQARQKMEPYFQQRLQKALNTFGNQTGTGLSSSIVTEIIPAAYYGRISQLIAPKGLQIFGKFDEQNNELSIHETREENDEDLMDKAVIKTLMNGGDVFIVDREQVPGGSEMAAVMRY